MFSTHHTEQEYRNYLPMGTTPIMLWTQAAVDPAATPAAVNPRVDRRMGKPATAAAPTPSEPATDVQSMLLGKTLMSLLLKLMHIFTVSYVEF